MKGIAQDIFRQALLHDLAGVHDQYAAADLVDDSQIVGDQQDRGPGLPVDPLQKLQHMRLCRDIQRSGGLVSDEELGPGDDAHCDHDTLPHASRELVGIHAHGLFRVRQAGHLEGFQSPLLDLRMAVLSVQQQDLSDLCADPLQGIEAGHGLLEDHGHVVSVDLPALRGGNRAQIFAVEHHAAFCHPDVVLEQILQGQSSHALAAAGLADDSDDLALSDGEADTVDNLVFTAVLIDRNGHMLHFQNVFTHLPVPSW